MIYFLALAPCISTGENCQPEALSCTSETTHSITRSEMLNQVEQAWVLPLSADLKDQTSPHNQPAISLWDQLHHLQLDKVVFKKTPLSHVLDYLGNLAEQAGVAINFMHLPHQGDPAVSGTYRGVSLYRLIELVAQSIQYQVDIKDELILLTPAQTLDGETLHTLYWPISRGAVARIIGDTQRLERLGPGMPKEASKVVHPYLVDEEKALKGFFARAGLLFEEPGCAFAFDGTHLIATHTQRQLDKFKHLLKNYEQAYQVEIEAKFMEVQQGVLEELGFQWRLRHQQDYLQTLSAEDRKTTLRSLSDAFTPKPSTQGDGAIVGPGQPGIGIPNVMPLFPGGLNVGAHAPYLGHILGIFNSWDIDVLIKALEQSSDCDLMSSPKLTVVSGKTAQIVVAKEFRYPQSYGKIDSAVGMTNSTSLTGGSAGVTITAGTPQDFVTRNVGVQMEVTPTVEHDGQHISLRLEPQVTEFEGFVEYGGRSLAISSGTTVQMPSGFFQPIFSVRQIKTEVTIRNQDAVIMGGLAREEQKKVNDKVPILGDIPLIGKLFQSKGETTQKRNLLIIVKGTVI